MKTKNILRFLTVFAFLILLVPAASFAQTKKVVPCDTCPTPTPTPTPTPVPTPPYRTVAVKTAANVLDNVNGTKVVADSNKVLHVIYADNGIKYVTSTNYGNTWTSPVTLAATGINPTIGVDDNNNLGVAYISGSNVQYAYKPAGGSWSSPIAISNTASSTDGKPSIAGYGTKMHIVWVGGWIRYTTFNTTSPVFTSSPENLNSILLCGGSYKYALPSIAVADSGTADPIIRVAYYSAYVSACGGNSTAGIRVLQRPTGTFFGNWDTSSPNMGSLGIYNEEQPITSIATTSASSVSLAANRTSGEFYAISCYTANNSLWRTNFAKGEPTSVYSWGTSAYFGGDTTSPVIADVTAVKQPIGGSPANGFFKTAYSFQTYGSVFVKEGNWIGSTPTYWSSSKKSTVGRTPHTVDCVFDDPVSGIAQGINVVYETSTEVRADFFNNIAY